MIKTKRMVTVDGKRSGSTDVRIQRCVECSLVTHVVCRAERVEVYDPDTTRIKLVTPEEYASTWRARDEITVHQLRLFRSE